MRHCPTLGLYNTVLIFVNSEIRKILDFLIFLRYYFFMIVPIEVVAFVSLSTLSIADIRYRKLPNWIIGSGTIVAGVAHSTQGSSILRAIEGGALIAAALLLLKLFYSMFTKREGMAYGDIKMGFLVGILAGTPLQSLFAVWAAIILGGAFVLASKGLGVDIKRGIPFGIFLAAGYYGREWMKEAFFALADMLYT